MCYSRELKWAVQAEQPLYDSEAIRRFAGIEVDNDRVPDETILLNFRHLLQRHRLTEAIFADVNAEMADKDITLSSGTLVGETIIDAPSSTTNNEDRRFRVVVHQAGKQLVFPH